MGGRRLAECSGGVLAFGEADCEVEDLSENCASSNLTSGRTVPVELASRISQSNKHRSSRMIRMRMGQQLRLCLHASPSALSWPRDLGIQNSWACEGNLGGKYLAKQ